MRRGSLFSASKQVHLKNRKGTGISYKRGNLKNNQYVFNGSSESEDEGEVEIFTLRQKKRAENFVERKLQPGDTLLNIALQYGYSVEELKRINNIHRDNEIYARTTLKVPVRITETVAVHKMPKEKDGISKEPTYESNHVRTVSISDAYRESKLEGNDAARRFLVAMDQDLARIRDNTTSKDHVAQYDFTVTQLGMENVSLSSRPPSNAAVNKSDTSWRCVQFLICSIILGFIAPIVYVLYLAEENDNQELLSGKDTVR
ncbi:lysM and putative peptidoglycan-binding domain-containing protein 3 [Hetaerina americana]|uniref:lysM and putative peptidoglycan-binding domain-containing protein 3 n=1 Tax=Hetaerina americana TaxID=62018 RepID=UPI003A7F11B6